MVCLIQLFFRDQFIYAQLQQELPELSFYGSMETGSVAKLYGNRQHLFETFFETSFGIQLRGSLHKFAHGDNADTFTISEIKRCVRELMKIYHIPRNVPIQRIELGINLPFACPEVVIDSAMLYNGRRGDRYTRKDYYAREWAFTSKWKDSEGKKRERVYYVAKLYKKADHILRYELHIEDIRKIAKTEIKVIADLLDDRKLLLALKYLYDSISMLFFVPDDPKKKLPGSLHEIWGTYRGDTFWRKYDERENKDAKCDLKKDITEAIQTYDLIDWQTVMRERFLEEGANIAEMSVSELSSTFSQLGLQEETVADPTGESDRNTEEVNTVTILRENCDSQKMRLADTILVQFNQSVANEGLMLDVSISKVLGCLTLLPRGPPAQRYSVLH